MGNSRVKPIIKKDVFLSEPKFWRGGRKGLFILSSLIGEESEPMGYNLDLINRHRFNVKTGKRFLEGSCPAPQLLIFDSPRRLSRLATVRFSERYLTLWDLPSQWIY